MNTRVQILFRLSTIILALVSGASGALGASKHVLVVTATQGFRHSSIPTAENVLATLGERTGLYTVDFVRGGPDGKSDGDVKEKMSPGALKKYDAVVFANTTGDLPMPDRDAFLQWIKSGKGFVGMHSCSDTFHGYPPFIEMLGGEFETHKEQALVDCLNQDLTHPSTRHFGPKYTVFDEIYILKNFYRDRVHGLLTLDKHPNTRMPGDYPIAWSKKVGSGRLFYTSLGHREDVWTSAAYQQHILGGIKWALGLEEGDATPQSTTTRLDAAESRQGYKLLFNGNDLTGWKLRHAQGHPSWSAQNGWLVNTIATNQHGTDLVSNEKFRDFVVRYEYMVPKGANSGFYLRGRHEIQIFDDFESKKTEMGGNGAIYSVKPVSLHASRAPGQWQDAEVTMRGNRITVILNGVKVHDNVEVNKATGGELDANLDQPGPFMLQGDHGAVAFRNIRIKSLN